MSSELKQENRVGSLSTPLGEDKLVLTAFDAVEGLSELFEFRVDAMSDDANIDFDQLLGRSCSVSVKLFEPQARRFSGLAVEAQATGMIQDLYTYQLVLRPALWLLTRTTNCRIYHKKTVIEIVSEVLEERQIDFRLATKDGYPKLDYCVQYRETDYNFIARLMEQHGVYFFFTHSGDSHKLVLADQTSSHEDVVGLSTVRYSTSSTAQHSMEQTLSSWSSERRFRTGKVELRDYNFRNPNEHLVGQASGFERYSKATTFEHYDYPGKHDNEGDGKKYAKIRLDAEQAIDHRRFASGEAVNLYPGGLVQVKEHPIESEDQKYLVVRCAHHLTNELYRSGTAPSAAERPYHGNFELQPSDHVYRAPIVTPKPVMHGPQTAKIVARDTSSDSEEIDVDDDGFGLVKVLFHWDRDARRSCWLRVAQLWAGPAWGGQFIPRIGMEVVVDFLEGDPDRPLVVGAVYNGNNKYPYDLPANKTQSGIKSDSSKGHGGYNEFMFEDLKGSEKIRMHAQKDHEVVILNSETTTIGENFSGGGASRATTLKQGDDTLTLNNGSQSVTIHGGSQTIGVDNDITIQSTAGGTIKVITGASSITLSPDSIQISSLTIQLSATKIDLN